MKTKALKLENDAIRGKRHAKDVMRTYALYFLRYGEKDP